MTRWALNLMYLAAAVWLASTTADTWGIVPLWASLTNAAASFAAVIPIVRERDLADEKRTTAELAERDRHCAEWHHVSVEATAHAALNKACCEHWWTSAGATHDPTCPNRRRSAA